MRHSDVGDYLLSLKKKRFSMNFAYDENKALQGGAGAFVNGTGANM